MNGQLVRRPEMRYFDIFFFEVGLSKGQYRIGLLVEGQDGDAAVKFLDLYTSKE
ncbi:MAG TPA: hypothetical protein VHE34_28495 [Puia sp.]|uniref:hypothetical protein n=1 Tax=Puia sp. TaxID=2045100 RepID=UPI002BB5B636|nr:hypothetical protein [Puia sp.]HVU99208.1 hypothetical protein [Puia sp.]